MINKTSFSRCNLSLQSTLRKNILGQNDHFSQEAAVLACRRCRQGPVKGLIIGVMLMQMPLPTQKSVKQCGPT